MWFIVVVTVCAVLAHFCVRRFLVAVVTSSVIAAAIFQVIVSIELGHPDKLWPIAFITTTAAGLAVSTVIGGLFRLLDLQGYRGRQSRGSDVPTTERGA